jgi:hypothetical protein
MKGASLFPLARKLALARNKSHVMNGNRAARQDVERIPFAEEIWHPLAGQYARPPQQNQKCCIDQARK